MGPQNKSIMNYQLQGLCVAMTRQHWKKQSWSKLIHFFCRHFKRLWFTVHYIRLCCILRNYFQLELYRSTTRRYVLNSRSRFNKQSLPLVHLANLYSAWWPSPKKDASEWITSFQISEYIRRVIKIKIQRRTFFSEVIKNHTQRGSYRFKLCCYYNMVRNVELIISRSSAQKRTFIPIKLSKDVIIFTCCH